MKKIALLLAAATTLSSCTYFSKTSSDQRAYDRYVKEHTGIQYKMKKQTRPKPSQLQGPAPSDPQIAAGMYGPPPSASGPEAATSGDSQNQ